ncbi:PfkB family carbohydrate kinase [Streptomyces klenkii]|uniref:PfkB family carbohydrate kinase n=1 Tax=Streptomyces klenkii TaxID=1420899 RepID=UPI003F4D3C5C
MTADTSTATEYLNQLTTALSEIDLSRVANWGSRLARLRGEGQRLLVAGNGGSAAEAQHLTAELVGRFRTERSPISALALHAETSSVTAISNDYGYEEVFARQVRAHARPGDIVLLMSGSGRSPNLLRAAEAAREAGAVTWALTGPAPNPLATLVDEAVTVTARSLSTVQECHLVAVHLMCAAVDAAVTPRDASATKAAARDTTATEAAATESVGSTPSAAPPLSSTSSPEPARERRPATARKARPDLVVVGDAFLDHDHLGRVERVASDEPALVVSGGSTHMRPGGAALAAVLTARQGYPVTLVTALGKDAVGDRLRTLLDEARVEVVDLGLDGSTAVKTRIRAAGRTLMMLDEHDVCPPVGREGETALAAARRALTAAGGILVSDYGRGVAAHAGLRAVLAEAARRSPLVWDPHPRGAAPVAHTAVVTPNSREARVIASLAGSDTLSDDVEAARAVWGAWGPVQVALTRHEHGAVLLTDADMPPLVVPTKVAAGRKADPCGAGDFFAGHLAAMLACGRLPSEAVTSAVAAASAYVAAGGPRSLEHSPEDPPDDDSAMTGPATGPMTGLSSGGPAAAAHGAVELADAVRARGGTVVAAGGCFDLLHIGHIQLLEQARRLGDCLIVCLNSDDSLSRLKGPSRPIVPAAQRALVLEALASVDAVLVFDEDTPEAAIRALRPSVWVKGGDYSGMEIPENELVSSLGGRTVVVPFVAGWSTSSLIESARTR